MNLKEYFESMTTDKLMIIMRGAPGSGKSYTAKQIQSELGGTILSTDDKHMVDGEYKFNAAKLGSYHKMTQQEAQELINQGISPIIVDNTNISFSEMKPYVTMAQQAEYKIQFKESGSDWWQKNKSQNSEDKEFLADELAKRNEHGVPKEAIKNMLNKWQHYDSTKHDEFVDNINKAKGY